MGFKWLVLLEQFISIHYVFPLFLLLCQFFTVASYILTDKHEGLSVKKSLLLGLFLFEKVA